MAYNRIFCSLTDAWGNLVYQFNVNIPLEEAKIEFRNEHGGYTITGIKLNESEKKSLLGMTNRNCFDKFIGNKNLEPRRSYPDPSEWEFTFTYDDGKSMETVHSGRGYGFYEMPIAISCLVDWVLRLGKTNAYLHNRYWY